MCEIRRFTAIGLADAFLRAVARAIADFASRSANFGKTKGRIMKTTLLLTALLCWSAHADFTADIYKTRSGDFFPDPNDWVFAGSIVYPSDPTSPALSLGMPNFDWHPFGLTWFNADIHGTLDIQQPGTGRLTLNGGISLYTLDGQPGGMQIGYLDIHPTEQFTLNVGQYQFDLKYQPPLRQNSEGERVPIGTAGVEIVDVDHTWGPSSSVPESTWLVWLFPLGLLLWRRK